MARSVVPLSVAAMRAIPLAEQATVGEHPDVHSSWPFGTNREHQGNDPPADGAGAREPPSKSAISPAAWIAGAGHKISPGRSPVPAHCSRYARNLAASYPGISPVPRLVTCVPLRAAIQPDDLLIQSCSDLLLSLSE